MGERQDPLLQPRSLTAGELIFGTQQVDFTSSYLIPSNRRGNVFGYIGLPGEPALGPPPSEMRRYAGFDTPDASLSGQWRDTQDRAVNVFTVGYSWRDLTIERSAFSRRQPDGKPRPSDTFRLDSRSVRLSFNPSPNWTVQLSRGSLSGLDQLVPNADVRRTSVSATYREEFKGGNWQTTLAWGRNSRRHHEATMGYLFESAVRFEGAHVLFGRVEQVASDDLARENDSQPARLFRLNKLSVGYFHDMRASGSVKIDIGLLASRHLIPNAMTISYGDNPISYMMFMRVKIK